MKKVLVTGAAGIIGVSVVKYLLSEGKYEITLLDLKNKRSMRRLKRYAKRTNIIYGDVNNDVLIDALVRDHDVVIHLAGALPPLANLKMDLCRIVDYEGTRNIVNAIRMYNPKCHLLYVSSTTVYGRENDNCKLSVKDAVNINDDDYYSLYKYSSEKLVMGELKNFTVYRVPAVFGSVGNDLPIYNVPKNSVVEYVSARDVAYALVSSIDNLKVINKHTYNLSGGVRCQTTYREHLIRLLQSYGLSMRLVVSYLLVDKNFYSGYYKDGDDLDMILGFRNDSLEGYYLSLEKRYHGKRRFLQRLLAKPFVFFLRRKVK